MVRYISDIMTTDIITVSSEESIYHTAKKMKDHIIGFIPVLEGRRLVGVVTDRDLVIRGYAENKSSSSPVKEVMTSECIVVDSHWSVDEAARTMADNKIRRVCVLDGDGLVGICALGDLAVRRKYETEAGEALSEISSPTRQNTVHQ